MKDDVRELTLFSRVSVYTYCQRDFDSVVRGVINQHCVVYKFSCDLCDTDYVGYTSRHLFQRIAEHKHSAIGKHLQEEHRLQPTNLQDQFRVLKKCRTKFDCLITGGPDHRQPRRCL